MDPPHILQQNSSIFSHEGIWIVIIFCANTTFWCIRQFYYSTKHLQTRSPRLFHSILLPIFYRIRITVYKLNLYFWCKPIFLYVSMWLRICSTASFYISIPIFKSFSTIPWRKKEKNIFLGAFRPAWSLYSSNFV